jgi:hypothetical protein
MAASSLVKTKRDGTITIIDGTSPTPNEYTVSFEVGDFSYSEEKADRTVIRDRGAIVGLRAGDDPVITASFSVHLRDLHNTTADVLLDFLYNRGYASSTTSVASTGGTGFEQYLVNIKFTIDANSVDSGEAVQSVTFAKCLCVYSLSEGDPDSLEISAECYGGLTFAYTP